MTQWQHNVRNDIEQRYKDLAFIASLARRDIERHLWLRKCRPDLASSAPQPPCRITYAKNLAGLQKRRSGRTVNKKHGLKTGDSSPRPRQHDSAKLPKFLTDQQNLQRLLEFVTTRRCRGSEEVPSASSTFGNKILDGEKAARETRSFDDPTHHRHKPTLAWLKFYHEKPLSVQSQDKRAIQTQIISRTRETKHRNDGTDLPNFRERKQTSTQTTWSTNLDGTKLSKFLDTEITKDLFKLSRRWIHMKMIERTFDLKYLTKKVVGEGAWRDATGIQAGAILLPVPGKAPGNDPQQEEAISGETAQTEELQDRSCAHDLECQYTVQVLERWAEPLQQYFDTLQEFEQELRKRWLTPKEHEPVSECQDAELDFHPRKRNDNAQTEKKHPQTELLFQNREVQMQPKNPLNYATKSKRGSVSHEKDQVHTTIVTKVASKRPAWHSPLRRQQTESGGAKDKITKKPSQTCHGTAGLRRSSERRSSEKLSVPAAPRRRRRKEKQPKTHDFTSQREAQCVTTSAGRHQSKQEKTNQTEGRKIGPTIDSEKQLMELPAAPLVHDLIGQREERNFIPSNDEEDHISVQFNFRKKETADEVAMMPESKVQETENRSDADAASKQLQQAGVDYRRRVERLADQFVNEAMEEVAQELDSFCHFVVEQMYSAEFTAS